MHFGPTEGTANFRFPPQGEREEYSFDPDLGERGEGQLARATDGRGVQHRNPGTLRRPTLPGRISGVIRAHTIVPAERTRRPRDEVQALKAALQAVHGENLELARRLGSRAR